MKNLLHHQANQAENDGGRSLAIWGRAHLVRFIEAFWFCLTFVLFLALGPFSAIAVLVGLGSLANEENRDRMTEPARL